MGTDTWRRLQDYEHVVEIHLSHNDGRRDLHAPIDQTTFGLDWATSQPSHIPVVVESYLHKVRHQDRRKMLDLIKSLEIEFLA